MSDFFRGLEGLHEGTVKMETGHLNRLEGSSERLDELRSTSLERSDKKLEASMSNWLEGSAEKADCSILEMLESEPSKAENAIWGSLDGAAESLDGSLLDSFEGHIEKVDESFLGALGNAEEKTKLSAGGILKAGFDWITDRMLDSCEKQIGEIPEGLDGIYQPNMTVEIDGILCETDDTGKIFKIDGEVVQDSDYECNGTQYLSDANGNILAWKGNPSYNPENERDSGAQINAGGMDRLKGDDGSHAVARIMNGSSGSENLMPMRDTLNRGDWKQGENTIVDALRNGKKVEDSGMVFRESDNTRPTKVAREFTHGDIREILVVDNVKGSHELLHDLKESVRHEDYKSIVNEIKQKEAGGSTVSVTSVLKQCDLEGNLKSVQVGIRDETTGTKNYKEFKP